MMYYTIPYYYKPQSIDSWLVNKHIVHSPGVMRLQPSPKLELKN